MRKLLRMNSSFHSSCKYLSLVLCVLFMASGASSVSALSPLGPKAVIPLIKKSDVVAVVKFDNPDNFTGMQTAAPYVPVTIRFERILKASSWCRPQLHTEQTPLLSHLGNHYANGAKYVMFLEKGTADQWWDLDDYPQLLTVTNGDLIETAAYTDLYLKFLAEVEKPPPVSLADFEGRLKLANLCIPEAPRHPLRTTDKMVIDTVQEQRLFETAQNALSSSGSSNLPLFIERLSKVISIFPERESLLQRAWAYLYMRRYKEAIADLDAIIDHPEYREPIYKVSNEQTVTCFETVYPDAKPYYLTWAYLSRGLAELCLNKNSQALNDCNTAAGYCKTSKPATLYGYGNLRPAKALCAYCYWRTGNYQAGKQFCNEVMPKESQPYPGAFFCAIKAHIDMDLKDDNAAWADECSR